MEKRRKGLDGRVSRSTTKSVSCSVCNGLGRWCRGCQNSEKVEWMIGAGYDVSMAEAMVAYQDGPCDSFAPCPNCNKNSEFWNSDAWKAFPKIIPHGDPLTGGLPICYLSGSTDPVGAFHLPSFRSLGRIVYEPTNDTLRKSTEKTDEKDCPFWYLSLNWAALFASGAWTLVPSTKQRKLYILFDDNLDQKRGHKINKREIHPSGLFHAVLGGKAALESERPELPTILYQRYSESTVQQKAVQTQTHIFASVSASNRSRLNDALAAVLISDTQ